MSLWPRGQSLLFLHSFVALAYIYMQGSGGAVKKDGCHFFMIIIIFNSVDNMTSFVHISVDVRVRCVKLDFNDHPSPILKTEV